MKRSRREIVYDIPLDALLKQVTEASPADRVTIVQSGLSFLDQRDIQVLANVMANWQCEYVETTHTTGAEFVKAFLDTGVQFSLPVYTKMYAILRTHPTTSQHLLQRVIVHMFERKGSSAWTSAKDVPSLETLRNTFITRHDMRQLALLFPSANTFRWFYKSFWEWIRTDEDMIFFNDLADSAWMAPRRRPVTHCCPICLSDKPENAFAVLACEQHRICASCVLSLIKHSTNGGYFECPMRCGWKMFALPLAVYNSLAYERRAMCSVSAPHSVVPLTRGQYVKVRLSKTYTTWMRVDDLVLPSVIRIGSDYGCPFFVLNRSDVILDVADVPADDEVFNDAVVHSLSKVCLAGVTFAPRAAHLQVLPMYYKTVLQNSCLKYLLLGAALPEEPKTLLEIVHVLQYTHFILPTFTLLSCPCETFASVQICMLCKQYVCGTCFGSVYSICALCKELNVC